MPYDFTHGQCPWPARNQVWIGRTEASSKGLVVIDDVHRGDRGGRIEWSAAEQLGMYDGRLHGQHSRGACSTRHLLRNYEHWCDRESLVDVLLPHRFAQAKEQGRIPGRTGSAVRRVLALMEESGTELLVERSSTDDWECVDDFLRDLDIAEFESVYARDLVPRKGWRVDLADHANRSRSRLDGMLRLLRTAQRVAIAA